MVNRPPPSLSTRVKANEVKNGESRMMVVLCALFSLSVPRGALGHDGDVSHSRPSSDLSSFNSSFAAFNCHDDEDDNASRRRVNKLRAGRNLMSPQTESIFSLFERGRERGKEREREEVRRREREKEREKESIIVLSASRCNVDLFKIARNASATLASDSGGASSTVCVSMMRFCVIDMRPKTATLLYNERQHRVRPVAFFLTF